MSGRIDLTGQRFGRLTAIKDVGTKYKRRLWLCQCDCGKTTKVITGILNFGKTKSCGCLNKEPKNQLNCGEAAFNELFSTYRNIATLKNREFSLTKQQFRNLVTDNCYYCDVKPSQQIKRKKGNGVFVYNGIDRINSNQGYNIINCVTCCKQCNYAKHNFSQQNFYNWIKRVYKHRVEGINV